MTDAELLDTALALPPTERAVLIDQLYQSLDPSSSADRDRKWILECDARSAAIENGAMGTTAADEVFSKLDEG